jgi:uncharacterized membrane protein YqjE
MHTQGADPVLETPPSPNGRGLGAAVKDVTDHAKALVSLEVELASLELKRKAAALGIGAALLVGGLVFGLFALGFGLATIAAALATFLSTWLALLIVTAFLLVVAAVMAFVGLRGLKKGTPPLPAQAIREAKLTQDALKSDAE